VRWRVDPGQRLALKYGFSYGDCVAVAPFSDFDVTLSKWQFSNDKMLKHYAFLPWSVKTGFYIVRSVKVMHKAPLLSRL
jgi:hypothetical protein